MVNFFLIKVCRYMKKVIEPKIKHFISTLDYNNLRGFSPHPLGSRPEWVPRFAQSSGEA